MNIPENLKEYIKSTEEKEIEYKKIEKVSSFSITLKKEEALEDFCHFKYIFDNAYSGKEYFENIGVDFEKCYQEIEDFINQYELINLLELIKKYYYTFEGKLFDAHLSFTFENERIKFIKSYAAYFADIIIEKKNDIYEVVSSKLDQIKSGDMISCEDKNLFPTLSPEGRNLYLFGIRAWDSTERISASVNGKTIDIPLHKCKAGEYKANSQKLKFYEKDGIPVVETPTFSIYKEDGTDSDFINEMSECGKKLKDTNAVVWNILSNGGGNSNYPMSFIEGLNEYAHWPSNYAVLSSPAINPNIENNNGISSRKWEHIHPSEPHDLNKGTYNGTLYVLINTHVASSGESAVSYAKSVRNCVLIGENTMGCGNFGDVISYKLPYSGMIMTVPYKLFIGMFKEGEGFTPDLWVDKEDVAGEVLKWLSNKQTYMP